MVTQRTLLACAAAAILLSACNSAAELVEDLPLPSTSAPTDAATSGPTGGEPGASSGSADTSDAATDSSSSSGSTEPAGTDAPAATGPPTGAARTPVNDKGGVGANGRAMLRPDRERLVVEIDIQEGVAVSQAAVDHLVDELARHVDKPGGIVFAGGNTFTSDRTQWTTDALREVAAANRTTASSDRDVSVHVLYVRGGFFRDGEQTAAIGVAYSASTVALFPQRWSGLGTVLGSSTAIERAVLVHEFGHLFGLVNLTYESDIDHEDPDHPGHSSNQGSVMFHAIESTLIGQVFSGPPPDRFDEADAADLAGLRSGRY